MSETVQDVQKDHSEPSQSVTSPPSAPTGTQPKPAEQEFRFKEGPFAGMTAAEASEQHNRLSSQQQQIINQVQNYVQQQQAAAQMQTQRPAALDPDLWHTDPEKAQTLLQQQIAAQMQQYVNQAGQPLIKGQASLAKAGSRNDPQYAETWRRYGSEIEQLMSQVPMQNQINKDMWDQAARLVRSQHIDEIAAEKAKELAATMAFTETGDQRSGTYTPPQVDAIQKIRESDFGKDHLANYSDAKIIQQAERMGNTVEEYADMVASTHVVSHPKKPGEWQNPNLTTQRR